MRLYEFEGSDLFRSEGIPVPDYAVAANPREARQKAEEIGLPVVIKAQVLIGGRGLAGGVQFAESLDQVEEVTRRVLDSSIGGLPVHRIMVTKKVAVAQEFYLGVTVDGYNGAPLVIFSMWSMTISASASRFNLVMYSFCQNITQDLVSGCLAPQLSHTSPRLLVLNSLIS